MIARRSQRVLGAAVFGVLLAQAVHKASVGALPEMLWACYVAGAAIGVGLVAGHRRPLVVGTLFQLAIGVPCWLLDAATTGMPSATSILAHGVPALAGALVVYDRGPWPTAAAAMAGAGYVLLVVISRIATPPELNVNLAFGPWAPWEGMTPAWTPWAVNAVLLAVLLATVGGLMRRWTTRA